MYGFTVVQDSRSSGFQKLTFASLAVIFLILVASSTALLADGLPEGTPLSVALEEMPAWLSTASIAEPTLNVAGYQNLEAFAVLPEASSAAGDQIAALRAWNEAGRLPLKNGFSRPLPLPQRVTVSSRASRQAQQSAIPFAGGLLRSDGERVGWAGEVRAEGAFRLRLLLSDVELPDSARLWITGSDGERTGPFGAEMVVDGKLWTPSASGPTVRIEIEATAPTDFLVDRVLEILPMNEVLQTSGEVSAANAAHAEAPLDWLDGIDRRGNSASEPLVLSCLTDASCVDLSLSGTDLRKAYAQLQFVVNGDSAFCTGGLLNDTEPTSFIPYLLTANHCFSSPSSAASLEAYWDYATNDCNGSPPNLFASPRSTGATLLATSRQSDFTLVRLNRVPGERVFLGWDSRPASVVPGTELYRVSHPAPNASIASQAFSQTTVSLAPRSCGGSSEGRPLDDFSKFIRSDKVVGGVFGGSSGAPVMIETGQVVGQLFGQCGSLPTEGCSLLNQVVDGAFSATFPLIQQFLAPSDSSGPTEPCVEDGTTACLLNNRFRATVRYRAGFDNQAANANASRKPVTGFGNPSFETVFFFFNSPDNIEIMLKMLDQGNTNSLGESTIAVLLGSATPLRTEVTIEDTETGARKTYISGFNTMMGSTDFTAFLK